MGLSDEVCNGCVSTYLEQNIGGTSFRKDKYGKFKFKPLDTFDFKEKIDLIKIDVEGAEVRVLNGAKNTIQKHKPVIVLETFIYKKQVDEFMKSISYKEIEAIRKEDIIYQYAAS